LCGEGVEGLEGDDLSIFSEAQGGDEEVKDTTEVLGLNLAGGSCQELVDIETKEDAHS
jgi:hypothetical protein